MSRELSKFKKTICKGAFSKRVKEAEDEIAKLEREDKYRDCCINHSKASIRLLRDTLSNADKVSRDALYQHE